MKFKIKPKAMAGVVTRDYVHQTTKAMAGVVTRDYVHQTTKLAFRKIDGNFFIVDAEKEMLHELNDLGSFTWNLIVKKKKSEEILKKIVEEFEVSATQAKKDFDDFINKLKEKGLVIRD